MLFCQNWCPECKRPSIDILTNYRGRLICKSCKRKLEQADEREKERKSSRKRTSIPYSSESY